MAIPGQWRYSENAYKRPNLVKLHNLSVFTACSLATQLHTDANQSNLMPYRDIGLHSVHMWPHNMEVINTEIIISPLLPCLDALRWGNGIYSSSSPLMEGHTYCTLHYEVMSLDEGQ